MYNVYYINLIDKHMLSLEKMCSCFCLHFDGSITVHVC